MLLLYENIKKLRKRNKWTQEDLAKRMGYTDRSMIAKIESGRVDLAQSKIVEFAKVFDVDPGDLMGWEHSVASGHTRSEPLIAFPPEYNFGDDLDEESIKFARLFQDASEEERALVMAYLKKKQPKS